MKQRAVELYMKCRGQRVVGGKGEVSMVGARGIS